MMTKYQKFDYKTVLNDLGYNLIDNGNHWRTRAVYRNGNNPTSILVYKDTGVWRDFGMGGESKSFVELVKLSNGDISSLDHGEFIEKPSPQEELMEKIYPLSYLEKLFPNYNFYKQRNISEGTQKLYRCGLASSGKMYRRVTFPIFNEHDQIIGWSGRKIDSDNDAPKWKHLGKKRNWLYPFCLDERFRSAVEQNKEIFLIESIGDSLALTEHDILNHFVLFGVSLSSKQLAKLIELNPSKIIISLNDDAANSQNTGLINSVKIYLNLLSFFPKERLFIYLPFDNDFGKMQTDAPVSIVEWHAIQVFPDVLLDNTTECLKRCLKIASGNDKVLSEQHLKNLRKMCNG